MKNPAGQIAYANSKARSKPRAGRHQALRTVVKMRLEFLMKRVDLTRYLAANGLILVREGAYHSV